MKCIENVLYLLFYAESDQKNMCIFRASVPLSLANCLLDTLLSISIQASIPWDVIQVMDECRWVLTRSG